MKGNKGLIPKQCYLTPVQMQFLKTYSVKHCVPSSEIIRKALDLFIEKEVKMENSNNVTKLKLISRLQREITNLDSMSEFLIPEDETLDQQIARLEKRKKELTESKLGNGRIWLND